MREHHPGVARLERSEQPQVTDFVMQTISKGDRTVTYAEARDFDDDRWRESNADDADYEPGWVEERRL